jgi:membrane protease YdiL (CAAX protease family)
MVPRPAPERQILTFDPISTAVSAVALFSKEKEVASGRLREIRETPVSRDPLPSSACYSSNVDELTRALPLPATVADTRNHLVSATTPDIDAATGITTVLRRPVLPKWFAAIQVALLCGLPTLGFITVVLVLGTQLPILEGEFPKQYPTLLFIALSALLDTALVALLIRIFLMLSGENSYNVFAGGGFRPVWGEILRGLLTVPVLMAGVAGMTWLLRTFAPWTHTVDVNPYERYMQNPIDATVLIIVVVLAGGVREELQRAFILHRFGQRLGGARIGLWLFTLLFGLLHLSQGVDAAITVGLLGLFWGVFYLRRQSAVGSMVSHAGFDVAQVLMVFLLR